MYAPSSSHCSTSVLHCSPALSPRCRCGTRVACYPPLESAALHAPMAFAPRPTLYRREPRTSHLAVAQPSDCRGLCSCDPPTAPTLTHASRPLRRVRLRLALPSRRDCRTARDKECGGCRHAQTCVLHNASQLRYSAAVPCHSTLAWGQAPRLAPRRSGDGLRSPAHCRELEHGTLAYARPSAK